MSDVTLQPPAEVVYSVNQRSGFRLPWQSRHEVKVVTSHNPSRLPYWPGLAATPEVGSFGRIRWINSMPSEGAWGRAWWSNR